MGKKRVTEGRPSLWVGSSRWERESEGEGERREEKLVE
jgi:hypothetical protein